MAWSRVLVIVLVVGLISLAIPIAIALAQGGSGTVVVRDSDPNKFQEQNSDSATITLTNVPGLSSSKVYEGWFVNTKTGRKESTGIMTLVDGTINQTFQVRETKQKLKEASQGVLLIALNEQNSSGQSGWATLTSMGSDTEVVLTLSAGTMETTLVHIHSGQCGPTLAGVIHPLTSFTGGSGQSTTTLTGVSLSSLLTGGMAINSHQTQNAGIYTACGNIPAAGDSITIDLNEQNSSGQSGKATLSDRAGDLEVVLSLSAGTMETTAVHIHSGQCGPTLAGVVHPLTSFTGGSGASVTLLSGVSLDSLLTGNFAINSHQTQNAGIYTACGNIPSPSTSGENLFAGFNAFVVTIEPVPDDDPGPSGVVPFIHEIPDGGILHLRHLLFSLNGNPVYTKGFYAGTDTPKGIIVGLREQTDKARLHSRLSVNSTSLAAVHTHACHVVNIVEGTGDGKGANFDASCGNPGDSFGMLSYADAAVLHADLAASSAPDDVTIAAHRDAVVAAAGRVKTQASSARDLALFALTINEESPARLIMQNVEGILNKALADAQASYTSAQDAGTFSPAPPVSPKAGDPFLPTIALWVLIAGAVLVFSGSLLYLRTRRLPA